MLKRLFFIFCIFPMGAISVYAAPPVSSTAKATPLPNYYLRIFNLGEVRQNIRDQREAPTSHYLDGGYRATKWQTEAHGRIYRDWERDKQEFDLFETSLSAKLFKDRLELKAGRQFFTPGFNVYLMDGMNADWNFSKRAGLGLYAGMPQYPETGDWSQDNGLLSGLHFFWNKVAGFTGNVGAVYRRRDLNRDNWIGNDQVVVASYFLYEPKEDGKFRLYSASEYQVSGNTLTQISLGGHFQIQRKHSLNLEFNVFDENREEIKETLLAVHADGRIYQGRFGARQQILRDVEFFQNYTFGHMEDPSGNMSRSHQAEAGIDYTLWAIRLNVRPRYAFTKSYGGRFHAGSVGFSKRFLKKVSVLVDNHYVKFHKRTNDNGSAFSSLLWTGWDITKNLTLGGHAEFLKNNDVEKEFRGGFLLQWGVGGVPQFPLAQRGVLL